MNGDKYIGQWFQNKMQGKGKYWHQDGDFYEGHWKDDKAHGYGIYRAVSGSTWAVHEASRALLEEFWPLLDAFQPACGNLARQLSL